MNRFRRISILVPALLVATLCVGCKSTPRMGQYTYRATLDAANRDAATGRMPSIEVDLVAVNEAEHDRWLSMSVDEYFRPGNVMRANADKFTMSFTQERSQPQLLPANDAIWQTWKRAGARNMFILASIPMRSGTPAVDPRRLVLPLDEKRWTGTLIDILIKPSGVVCQTPMRPVKE